MNNINGLENKTKKITYIGIQLSIALIIFVIESQIPIIFPGIKLGLANAVSLFVMYTMGPKEAITIMILRTFLGSVFGGNLYGFFFSISGGLLSNMIMISLYKYYKNEISILFLSVAGAVFHNLGQLIVASFLISDVKIFLYFPILIIAGAITGVFVGIVVSNLTKRLGK